VTGTWRELRDAARARLPGPEVGWLIEEASGLSAAEQAAALDAVADERQAASLDEMVARRVAGEPLQYVLGRWSFRTLDLLVDRRVLIPRPETEVVAGLAVDALRARGGTPTAVDLGTGSGAIALSLAAERWPDVEVWATDASPDALAVARANLAGLGRRAAAVRLAEGDWFAALPDDLRGRVDVVVSNPPYVGTAEPLPASVAEWEPAHALLAGPDGLDDLRRLIVGSPEWLVDDGTLVLEIGETQGDAVRELARAAGFTDVAIHPDLAGRPRALVAHR
jgi:release factor glutamine methyltransferase